MKFKVCLILIFLISLCGGYDKVCSASNGYIAVEQLERQMDDDFLFQESGCRVIYKSNNSSKDELQEIQQRLNAEYDGYFNISDNRVNIRTSLLEIEAEAFQERGTTIVYLTIINYKKERTISDLMKELTRIESKNIFDIRYFQYVKGKINNIEEKIAKLQKVPQIKKIDTLDIHNGYVGTGQLSDGERVNIALNSYDTGNYLIIGTPVIFTTY